MWDTLKKTAQHPAVQFLRKLCGDPVQVYAVFLVMTVMDYYHSEYTTTTRTGRGCIRSSQSLCPLC